MSGPDSSAEATEERPDLSVVVVTPGRFAQLRRTVEHVRAQSIRHRIELVIVATDEQAVADRTPADTDGFWGVEVIAAGPIDNVDHASAHGIHAARAPHVAIIEDHGYPQPGWAEAVLRAYDAGYDAVGAVMLNANPHRRLSWVNLLLAYGWWTDPDGGGPVEDVPGHNITYRTEVLEASRDDLWRHLGRAGDLHDRLREQQRRFWLAPDAAVAHVNPSRLSSTAELRFNAGRLYGAQRADSEGWGTARRWLYALAAPLIVLVRLLRIQRDHLTAPVHTHLVPGIYPALLVGLALDAAGQAAGYVGGVGRSIDVLATFEMDRIQHLTARDRRQLGW